MSFANKSALVTGGTGAIGGAICEELLKNGVTHLAVLDISSKEPAVVDQWRKNYPKASIIYYQVDVSSQEELENCYKEFTKNIKNLDIVVNSAGLFNEQTPKKVIDVNLTGVIQSTKIALEYMRMDNGKGNGGTILNISSTGGLKIFSGSPTYCATKFGVIVYTRALSHAREYLGIKFLTLCPGTTDSQLFTDFLNHSFLVPKTRMDKIKRDHPAQSPTAVGKAGVKMLLEGENGSSWIIDDNKIQKVPISLLSAIS